MVVGKMHIDHFTTWERFATYWDPPIPATMKPLTLICVFLIAVQSINNLIIDWKNPKQKNNTTQLKI